MKCKCGGERELVVKKVDGYQRYRGRSHCPKCRTTIELECADVQRLVAELTKEEKNDLKAD